MWEYLFATYRKRPGADENPYVKGAEGRKEWNDRYANMQDSIKHWRWAFFGALIISVIFAIALAKIAMESKVRPYAVETNQGMPYAIKPMKSFSAHDERLINFAINQFIINARTVISDTQAEKSLLNKVYAHSANKTILFLHDYYLKNNPFDLASRYTVSVNIISALPLSEYTWQVTWDETKHSTHDGHALGTSRWVANITYQFGDINPKFMADNPFGIYITQIFWSQTQSS
jgi:type IV secretion system protein VirB5